MGARNTVQAHGSDPGVVLTITLRKKLQMAGYYALSVTVLMGDAEDPSKPYRILHWQEAVGW